MMRRYNRSVRIVAAVAAAAVLFFGALIVRATKGGATSDSLTYSGTLTGVGAGMQTFSFVLHKLGSSCSVTKAANVAASGAFAVTFSSFDSACLTGFFDGSDVTVDVTVAGVTITGQPITPVPYAKYSDTAINYAPNSPISQIVPVGTVIAYAGVSGGGTNPPPGWLLCDGSAVSRATYASLFTVIGTSVGVGDGTNTFNVPDYRGLFLRGFDQGNGADPDATTRAAMNSGGNTGDKVGTIEADAFASHNHALGSQVWCISPAGTTTCAFGTNGAVNNNPPTASTGGSETRPKNATVNYLIKY
jgi:microcystin-dependent protein